MYLVTSTDLKVTEDGQGASEEFWREALPSYLKKGDKVTISIHGTDVNLFQSFYGVKARYQGSAEAGAGFRQLNYFEGGQVETRIMYPR